MYFISSGTVRGCNGGQDEKRGYLTTVVSWGVGIALMYFNGEAGCNEYFPLVF